MNITMINGLAVGSGKTKMSKTYEDGVREERERVLKILKKPFRIRKIEDMNISAEESEHLNELAVYAQSVAIKTDVDTSDEEWEKIFIVLCAIEKTIGWVEGGETYKKLQKEHGWGDNAPPPWVNIEEVEQ